MYYIFSDMTYGYNGLVPDGTGFRSLTVSTSVQHRHWAGDCGQCLPKMLEAKNSLIESSRNNLSEASIAPNHLDLCDVISFSFSIAPTQDS